MDKRITVALIDGGLPDTGEFNIVSRVGFRLDGNKVIRTSKPKVDNDHGVTVARCIKKVYSNVDFIDINILDENMESCGMILLEALRYCREVNAQVINMSLGTTRLRYYFKMKRIINSLLREEKIIVAAENNGTKRSYPANINGVTGIKGVGTLDMNRVKYRGSFYYTSAVFEDKGGNSIACGYMTGHICRALNKYGNKKINELLKRGKFNE